MGRSAADRRGPHDRLTRLHSRLLQQRGARAGPGRQAQCRPSRWADGLFQIYRGRARKRPVRGDRVRLTPNMRDFVSVAKREDPTMSQPAMIDTAKETPKDASAPVIAQHAAMLKALPFSDTRDF